MVLEVLAESNLTFLEIHNKLGINKASLSRILNSILINGYIRKDPTTQKFSLSIKTFELGVNSVRKLSYTNLIKPHLEELSQKLNVIAQFSIEYENEIMCIESFDSNDKNVFSIYTKVGQKSPIYSTSAGKSILSTYTNEEIKSKWQSLNVQQLTPNTITTLDEFLNNINQIREKKYALDMEENEIGLFCIGCALKNYNNQPIGAISLSFKNFTEEKECVYSKTLLEHIEAISTVLGLVY